VIRKTLYRGFDNMADLQREENLQMQGVEYIQDLGELPAMGFVLKENHEISVSLSLSLCPHSLDIHPIPKLNLPIYDFTGK
jgi:hypothetical protein